MESDKKKRSFVHCHLCSKHVKYCGNISNMQVHLHVANQNYLAF